MSAPNFCRYEASKYYAIGVTGETDDCFFYNDTKENVLSDLENLTENTNYYTCENDNVIHKISRYYGGDYIQSIAIDKKICDFTVNVVLHVITSCGRYAGATLDYISEIQIDGYEQNDFNDFFKYFDYKDLDSYSDMPSGMLKIQSKNIEKFIRSAYAELTEHVEQILENNCEAKLVQTALFSNGEAIYSKVS